MLSIAIVSRIFLTGVYRAVATRLLNADNVLLLSVGVFWLLRCVVNVLWMF